jgi:hypothetical protein
MALPRESEPTMIAKLLLQNSIYVVVMGGLLFTSAGTLDWPGAWVFRENSFAAPVVKVQSGRASRDLDRPLCFCAPSHV